MAKPRPPRTSSGGYVELSSVDADDYEKDNDEKVNHHSSAGDEKVKPGRASTAFLNLISGKSEHEDPADIVHVDSPVWYVFKVIFVYILLLVDIFMNSSINSDDYGKLAQNDFWPILFLILQASCQVFIFLTLFLMMCGTYLMRMGLPGVMLADFKYLGVSQVIYLILTMVLGAMRVVRFQEDRGNLDPRRLWGMPGYTFVFVIQNISAAIYYHQVVHASIKLSEEKYYSKKYWGNLRDQIR